MKTSHTGFSLIEILVGVIIISTIMLAGFQALALVGVSKVKLIQQTQIEKEAFFASEKFFEMIKTGGTIDYEEYWNRYNNASQTYASGSFVAPSGFGNFGRLGTVGSTTYGQELYFCRSTHLVGQQLGEDGCRAAVLNSNTGSQVDQYQRYGQYAEQFIDYNSDGDNNYGDENGDGLMQGDDDDLFLGIGPEAFPQGADTGELYLINASGDERTYFRWRVSRDTDAPPTSTCTALVPGQKAMTGTGCLGTIEFLKLTGKDWGYDHNPATTEKSQGDGIIDTWLIHKDFNTTTSDTIAGSNTNSYWIPIFPNTIHVSEVEFYVYPHKSLEYSWRDRDLSIQMAPYIQLKMKLQPSWKEKRKIKGNTPEVNIRTTIQLSDLHYK